jgi:hypothetical protein
VRRKLIYSMGVSLDGFIAGRDGEIGWGAPDEELHRFWPAEFVLLEAEARGSVVAVAVAVAGVRRACDGGGVGWWRFRCLPGALWLAGCGRRMGVGRVCLVLMVPVAITAAPSAATAILVVAPMPAMVSVRRLRTPVLLDRSKRSHGRAFDALLSDAQATLYGAQHGDFGPQFGPPSDFGPSADILAPDEFGSNTGETTDGHGWFRTTDLSRVKCCHWGRAGGRNPAWVLEFHPSRPSRARRPDCRCLRAIPGDIGRAAISSAGNPAGLESAATSVLPAGTHGRALGTAEPQGDHRRGGRALPGAYTDQCR